MQDTTQKLGNIGAGHAVYAIEQPPWGMTLQCTKCGQSLNMGIDLAHQIASGKVTITNHALMEKCSANN